VKDYKKNIPPSPLAFKKEEQWQAVRKKMGSKQQTSSPVLKSINGP